MKESHEEALEKKELKIKGCHKQKEDLMRQ